MLDKDGALAMYQKLYSHKYPKALPEEMFDLKTPNVNWDDLSVMRELTCVNHPWSRLITKNPWTKSIFFAQGPYGLPSEYDEHCECPFSDLRLVIDFRAQQANRI